jgi:hypothetical protein
VARRCGRRSGVGRAFGAAGIFRLFAAWRLHRSRKVWSRFQNSAIIELVALRTAAAPWYSHSGDVSARIAEKMIY